MARDCPDRQRGANWRNDDGPPARAQIGAGGDAVDREYEQLMNELSGGPAIANGAAPARIEAGTRGQEDGNGYGGGDNTKPWQRGPTGAPAPWQQRRDDYGNGGGGGGSGNTRGGPAPWAQGGRGGGDNYAGYGRESAAPSGGAPWQQAAPQQNYGNYGAYPGYEQYAQPPPPPSVGAPPGMSSYPGYGGSAPPPPGEAPPPPPPGDAPPPPPPGF